MKTRAKRKIHNLRSCSLDFVGSTLSQVPTIGITYDVQGDLDGNANNGTITSVSIIDPVGGGILPLPKIVCRLHSMPVTQRQLVLLRWTSHPVLLVRFQPISKFNCNF